MVTTTSERDARFAAYFTGRPAILAPMEDVTDVVFRALSRRHGAHLCVTEFVNVEGLLRGCKNAQRKITLPDGDQPTAIQIYGANPERLAEAAAVAEAASPAFIDINCGCWVPKVAGRGAGAAWLRDPTAMVAMAKMVVDAVKLPVTVKTRIGFGPESHMPIVELAERLEGVGVRALTVHCRTAKMGHSGEPDWTWAQKAQSRVKIPVVVNGGIRSAEDALRALETTGCAGVMIGQRAIEHPWIFDEIRSLLDRGVHLPKPSALDRLTLCREHLLANVAQRGQPKGVQCTRRHLSGYLKGLPGAAAVRQALNHCDTLDGNLAILAEAEARVRRGDADAAAA